MKTVTTLFFILFNISVTSAQTYISKSQNLLEKTDDGISVNKLTDTYIVKTNFSSALKVGAAIELKLTSESTNRTYSLILKKVYWQGKTKEFDCAIEQSQNSYPSIKVNFEKGDPGSDVDLFVSIEEGKRTFTIYCVKI